MKMFIKKNIRTILFFLLTIFYFEYSVTIAYDSAHYMNYVNIFEGTALWSSWDVVRGPVFPFVIHFGNFLFGKSVQGLIMNSYVYYLFMLLFTYKILVYFFDKLKVSLKIKNKCIFVILFLIVTNSIIYGFYHCLLTEFVAITLAVISCYLSFLWLDVDEVNDKRRYIIYSVLFDLLIIFSWFLKQPYVSCSLFVLVVAWIISIFERHNMMNTLIRTVTVLFSGIILFVSISCWNIFLVNMGNNPNSDRNPTNSLGNQLVDAIDFVRIQNDSHLVNHPNYIKSIKLSKNERKVVNKLITSNKEFLIVNYFDGNKVVESDYLICKDGNISVISALKYIATVFVSRPLQLFDSYFSNYMSLIDIYSTKSFDGVGYVSYRKVNILFSNEISTLGLSPYIYGNSNIYDMSKSMYNKVKCYEQYHYTFKGLNVIMRFLGKIYLLLFKVLFLLLPFLLIISIILRFSKKFYSKRKSMNFVIILFSFSFLHMILHTITGAIIDRYAVPVFIPVFLGTFMFGFLIMCNKNKYSR